MTNYASAAKRGLIKTHKKTLTNLMEEHKREYHNLEKSNKIWLQVVHLMREISRLEDPETQKKPTCTLDPYEDSDRAPWGGIR